jgi:hypothetical protein
MTAEPVDGLSVADWIAHGGEPAGQACFADVAEQLRVGDRP